MSPPLCSIVFLRVMLVQAMNGIDFNAEQRRVLEVR